MRQRKPDLESLKDFESLAERSGPEEFKLAVGTVVLLVKHELDCAEVGRFGEVLLELYCTFSCTCGASFEDWCWEEIVECSCGQVFPVGGGFEDFALSYTFTPESTEEELYRLRREVMGSVERLGDRSLESGLLGSGIGEALSAWVRLVFCRLELLTADPAAPFGAHGLDGALGMGYGEHTCNSLR